VVDARRQVGANGEEAVAAWYRAAGYTVLDRNWRVREGELDVVAANGEYLVFCEVKTRRGDRYGLPVEAVTARKQQRLHHLAMLWLGQHEADGQRRRRALRFDVASVVPDGRGGWNVSVLEAAF
jgi:putative endonuclease